MTPPLLERAEAPAASAVLAGVSIGAADGVSLYRELSSAAQSSETRERYLLRLLKAAIAVTGAEAGIIVMRDARGGPALGPRLLSADMTNAQEAVARELKTLAGSVMEEGNPVALPTREPALEGMLVLASPVGTAPPAGEVLVLFLRGSRLPTAILLSTAQLFTGFIDLYDVNHRDEDVRWEAGLSAQLIELVAGVSAIPDNREALHTLSCDLESLVGCSHVTLASTTSNGRVRRVDIVSGLSDHDARSRLTRALRDALNDALEAGAAVAWPRDGLPGDALPGHRALHAATECSYSISAPLRTLDGNDVGAILCWWDGPPTDRARSLATINAATLPMAGLYPSLQRRGARGRASGGRKDGKLLGPILTVAVLAALIASLFWPMTYRVTASVVLEPTLSRFVTAPFDGILERSAVIPGEFADPEQVLASLDGKDLVIQLADVEAEMQAAEKRRDIMLADGQTHGAQIARLELERMLNKRALLQDRLDNLEIRSPIAGLVVSGNLDKLIGSPVSRGQELFEIAPLESMVAEIGIPGDRISHVTTGMPVQMQIEGVPDRSWEATLAEFRPRAEVRDGENVFVSETGIANPDELLKPGMRGTARIDAGEKRLGWILFHRPMEKLRLWLGWARKDAS